jgi:hypothetical protein
MALIFFLLTVFSTSAFAYTGLIARRHEPRSKIILNVAGIDILPTSMLLNKEEALALALAQISLPLKLTDWARCRVPMHQTSPLDWDSIPIDADPLSTTWRSHPPSEGGGSSGARRWARLVEARAKAGSVEPTRTAASSSLAADTNIAGSISTYSTAGVLSEENGNVSRKEILYSTPRGERKRVQVQNFYQLLRPLLAGLRPTIESCTVVDFGCGSGNLLLPLAALFRDVTFVAVDMNPRCHWSSPIVASDSRPYGARLPASQLVEDLKQVVLAASCFSLNQALKVIRRDRSGRWICLRRGRSALGSPTWSLSSGVSRPTRGPATWRSRCTVAAR